MRRIDNKRTPMVIASAIAMCGAFLFTGCAPLKPIGGNGITIAQPASAVPQDAANLQPPEISVGSGVPSSLNGKAAEPPKLVGVTSTIRGQSPDTNPVRSAFGQSIPGTSGSAVSPIPGSYTPGRVRPVQYGSPPVGAQPAAQVAQLQPSQVQPAAPYVPPGTYGGPQPPPSLNGNQYSTPSIGNSQYDSRLNYYQTNPQPAQPSNAVPSVVGSVPGVSQPAANYTVPPAPATDTTINGGPILPLAGSAFDVSGTAPPPPLMQPRIRTVPVDVYVTPARTGRFMVGGAVNSDAGLTGQIVLDEKNFDILRFPRSFQDLFSGYAFRGAGQTFRLEAVPGNQFQRYMVSFGQPYLFNYLPLSLSLQGFLFDRRYRDWDESRLGGRAQLGYRVTNQLSVSGAIRAENVDFHNLRLPGTTGGYLDSFLGEHDLYSGSVRLTHDTRDIPFAPTEGHLLELSYEQAFGDFSYDRWQLDARQYFLIRERADRSGRHTLAFTNRLGISGNDTPVFENFFAGGYSTIRGFDFRGASPVVNDNQVGGRFSFLGSLEYQFPLTADDATKGVLFVDYGTVERDIEIDRDNFRVAPGFGFRISMPALGPAPLAFDFAFPVAHADTDDRQVFSFFMGFSR